MLELVENVTDAHAEGEVRLELGRGWLEQGFTRSSNRGRDAVLGSVNPEDSQQANVNKGGGGRNGMRIHLTSLHLTYLTLTSLHLTPNYYFHAESIDGN